MEEHKSFVALEYTKGNISKADLIKIVGKKDAGDVDLIIKKTKEDFKAAKNFAKRLK